LYRASVLEICRQTTPRERERERESERERERERERKGERERERGTREMEIERERGREKGGDNFLDCKSADLPHAKSKNLQGVRARKSEKSNLLDNRSF
jgi:hypothetical protein